MADREKSHETSCKNRAVLYRKNSRTGLLKVSCDTFLSLSHGETSFMKPNLMRLVASCDTALTGQLQHVLERVLHIDARFVRNKNKVFTEMTSREH